MRHNLKAAAVSVLAIMAALAMSIPAYAADKIYISHCFVQD